MHCGWSKLLLPERNLFDNQFVSICLLLQLSWARYDMSCSFRWFHEISINDFSGIRFSIRWLFFIAPFFVDAPGIYFPTLFLTDDFIDLVCLIVVFLNMWTYYFCVEAWFRRNMDSDPWWRYWCWIWCLLRCFLSYCIEFDFWYLPEPLRITCSCWITSLDCNSADSIWDSTFNWETTFVNGGFARSF